MTKRVWQVAAAAWLTTVGCACAVPVATAAAVPVVSETLSLGQEIAAVPVTAAKVLYLPLGVVECVFSPLPDIEFMSGLRHIGQGVVAPFKLVEAVVSLPYDAVKAAAGTVNAVPKVAGLPAVVPVP